MENKKTILGTPAQAMKRLGISRNTMYEDLLKRKDFPAFKIKSRYFINLELLSDWAKKQCNKK